MADRALAILLSVLDLPEPEQADAIDRECGDDAELRERVLRLLSTDGEEDGFLNPDALRSTALGGIDFAEEMPDRIGPYALKERLGEGGFGIVYRAEQHEPIQRTVAIKVVKPGMDSRSVLRRFELERRSLSRMDHPNVSRVLDGGMIGDARSSARPYFVMELVDGPTITEYAADQQLSIGERVGLVAQICDAVQHAHSKGVIHRDLKPANILVTTVDGKPVCKVIDFGVAKALEETAGAQAQATSPGAMVGTPQYMSPEQMRGSSDIDTRTDVYAIGVLLYELIVGAPPFDSKAWKGLGVGEMIRHIESTEPEAPSSRLATLARAHTGAESTARPRGPDSRVPKDLDWIVLRAMAKEPGRRYPTAVSLGDDLARFLRLEPVEAGPPAVSYKVAKFVRRHRAGVIAAGVAGLALIAGGAASVVFGISAEQARRLEQTQREEADRARIAEREQRKAANRALGRVEDINEFLLRDLFLAVAAAELGPDAKLADLIDRAAPTIPVRFADDPDMQFRAHYLLGSMYNQLHQTEKAIHHFSQSILVIDDLVDTPASEIWQAYKGRGNTYLNNGQLEAAEQDLRLALQYIDSMEQIDLRERRSVLATTATIYQAQERYEEAEPLLAWCIDTALHKESPRDNYAIGVMLSVRGAMLDNLGRYEESLASAEQMIAFGETLEGNLRATTVLTGEMRRMSALTQLNRADEVADAAIDQIELMERYFGRNSPNYALSKFNAGQVLDRAGRIQESERYMLEGIDDIKRIFGPHHYEVERYTNHLATYYSNWGRRDEHMETRARGLLLRVYVAGPGEAESVIEAVRLGIELLDDPLDWVAYAADERRSVPPGHNKRGRYLANLAIAAFELGLDLPVEEMLTDAFDAIPAAERPDEVRRILEGVTPVFFESQGRPEDADQWRARLAPSPQPDGE